MFEPFSLQKGSQVLIIITRNKMPGFPFEMFPGKAELKEGIYRYLVSGVLALSAGFLLFKPGF
jgi:hypothetical protein